MDLHAARLQSKFDDFRWIDLLNEWLNDCVIDWLVKTKSKSKHVYFQRLVMRVSNIKKQYSSSQHTPLQTGFWQADQLIDWLTDQLVLIFCPLSIVQVIPKRSGNGHRITSCMRSCPRSQRGARSFMKITGRGNFASGSRGKGIGPGLRLLLWSNSDTKRRFYGHQDLTSKVHWTSGDIHWPSVCSKGWRPKKIVTMLLNIQ